MNPSVSATSAVATPKKKKKWKDIEAREPSVTFKDFGGSSKVIEVGFMFIYKHAHRHARFHVFKKVDPSDDMV
jgi:hypothetical protein